VKNSFVFCLGRALSSVGAGYRAQAQGGGGTPPLQPPDPSLLSNVPEACHAILIAMGHAFACAKQVVSLLTNVGTAHLRQSADGGHTPSG